MSNNDLQTLLAQLDARLRAAGSLDAETRSQLKTVSSDIAKTLAQDDADNGAHESRLEALAVKFEVDHPAIADVLRQIVDVLGKAGI